MTFEHEEEELSMNILQQCQQWHEEEQDQQIIDALEVLAESERGYELTSMLARAYNNIAQPKMDNYRELLERALALLQSVELDGLADPLWHFRIGYSLFFLDREPEALAHFEQVLALDPNDEDAARFASECRMIIEEETVVKPFTMDRLTEYFDNNDWKYDVLEDGTLKSRFIDFIILICAVDSDIEFESFWMPDAPLELRGEMVNACNEWNRDAKRPKAYIVTRDDGVISVVGEHFVFAGPGMTDTQLFVNLQCFLNASAGMCKFFSERFPQMLPTEDETPDGDA